MTYTHEILSELQRRGVMTSDQFDAAAGLMDNAVVTAGKKKPVKKKAKKAKIQTPASLIPFCGEVNDEWCCAARVNHGLYTQCTKGRIEGEDFCGICLKQSENSASGKPNGGDIRQRVTDGAAWRDPKGKAPITFATLAAKPKFSALNIETATAEAAKFGWTIPESELTAAPSKRGRPKKVVEVSDTDSEDGKPKKRGRPKKKVAQKQELSDLIKQQALTAVAEITAADNNLPIAAAKAVNKKVKKTKKAKAPKGPTKKELKLQATREKLLKEISEVDSDSSTTTAAASCVSNADLRTFLKATKVAKKAKDKQAKADLKAANKEAQKTAKANAKQAKKDAAQKLKDEKAAAKQAKKDAAQKLKDEKAAQKVKEAEDKAEKKAQKEAETRIKKMKLLGDLAKISTTSTVCLKLTTDNSMKEIREAIKAAKAAAKTLKATKEAEKKVVADQTPELEEEVIDSSDDELGTGGDEFELGDITGITDASAHPFNPTTGMCLSSEEAAGQEIEYYAECDESSFPNPIPDEEGDICLYNAEGDMVATFQDGEVIPVEEE